ncbi:Protein of unknown function DUF88 [Rhizobium leguminosarum bv. trifolii WSM2012]|nr:Protein of unknown function DUF88 [Rhizobium leguminosarum bv. trifolii WSM2012]
MRAIFYIDGFNFYHARLRKNRQFRWLNVHALAQALATADDPNTTIDLVNFYTAYVSGKIDPAAVGKQQAYLAALKSTGAIAIHSGNFTISNRWVKLVHPPMAKPDGYVWPQPYPEFVYVATPQEKGTDVKLGVHLVRDAFQNAFDVAYVLTNDTDLVEPIRIATEDLGKTVVVVAPVLPQQANRPVPAPSLTKVASKVAYITDADLAAAQFADPLPRGKMKPLTKPVNWV